MTDVLQPDQVRGYQNLQKDESDKMAPTLSIIGVGQQGPGPQIVLKMACAPPPNNPVNTNVCPPPSPPPTHTH